MAKKKTERRTSRRAVAKRSIRRNADSILSTLFAIAVACAAAYAFYTYLDQSTYVRVKTIKVMGANLVDPNEIVAASGVTSEDNILLLPTAEIKAKVSAMPYIERCRVTRVFPDMVSITVEERVPVATLALRNQYFVIDANLNVLDKLDLHEPHTGPLVTQVPGLGTVEPGAHLTQPSLREAVDVWLAFRETQVAKSVTVSEIAAPSTSDIRMYCNELTYEIRWGRGQPFQQATNLDTVWQYKNGRLDCKEYVDLRFDRDVACL
jgi:cell division septal protein FtsQ